MADETDAPRLTRREWLQTSAALGAAVVVPQLPVGARIAQGCGIREEN